MSALLVLLRLVCFSPGYFGLTVVFATLMFFWLPIPIGLAARAFFDALTGEAAAGVNAWSAIAVLAVLQLVEVCVGPLLNNPWNGLQQKSQVLLQRNLFAAILRGYGRFGLRVSAGDAISRFRDDPRGIADGLDALCDLIGRTLFAAGALVLMWRISPMLTGVLCVPLLASAWLTEALGTRTLRYHAASQAATSGVTGFLGELLGGQLAVNVAGAVPHALERLSELGDARRHMAVRGHVFDVLTDSFSVNLGHLGIGLVLLLGAQAIADGNFSVGDFALFVVYLDQLVWYPAEIARLISDLKRTEVSYGRMLAIVPGEAPGALVAPAPVYLSGGAPPAAPTVVQRQPLECLEVRGLSYAYPDGAHGISDVSFAARRGSFTVITGRIGAGKSTLLHVLLGLLPHHAGNMLWNGVVVTAPDVFFVPPRSAFTPQVPRLFSASLRENLALGRGGLDDAVERAVEASVLTHDVAQLADGLDTRVGPRGVKLSGGQVQRAAVARMLLTDAELLVFDDVSSALDAETEAELWARLARQSTTCIVVSHRPAAIQRADQLLTLDGGRLVDQASSRC